MMTLSLAVRNLLRNRRRSLATLLAMAIGCASILLFGGFSGNINLEMHSRIVQRGGHLQIQHRDFFSYGSGNPTAYGIANYEQILRDINDDSELQKMVLIATPTLQFGGIAGNYAASVSRTVIGSGFVAPDINRMRAWNDFGLRSKMPAFALEGSDADAAVVGTGVARVLQLCADLNVRNCVNPEPENKPAGGAIPEDIAQLGELESANVPVVNKIDKPRIEVLAVNARGAPNVTSLQVIRAEDQGFKELDEVTLLMHLPKLQQLVYGQSQPKATSIMVQLHHSNQVSAALARLTPILDRHSASQPLIVRDFRSLNPFFVQTEAMFDTIFGFVYLLIGAIVLFTVSNTMNTAIVERTVEIGTLRAIGLRRAGIMRMFVAEGALLGVCGAVVGVLLALLLSFLLNAMKIPWVPPSTIEPVPLTVRVWGEATMIVGSALGLIAIAVLSAWLPAYRAASLNVVDALRHV